MTFMYFTFALTKNVLLSSYQKIGSFYRICALGSDKLEKRT